MPSPPRKKGVFMISVNQGPSSRVVENGGNREWHGSEINWSGKLLMRGLHHFHESPAVSALVSLSRTSVHLECIAYLQQNEATEKASS